MRDKLDQLAPCGCRWFSFSFCASAPIATDVPNGPATVLLPGAGPIQTERKIMTTMAELEEMAAQSINSWALGCAGESAERVQRSIAAFFAGRPATIDEVAAGAFVDAMLHRMKEIERTSHNNNRTLH